ncbi:MAG TPA: UDP-N-acetylmuramate dehydrogenase [Candidatus Saccharimonadia bacterium]|nr:UDP-N-acetylmuramate dehydrogenase [Candidatus Saccharimonadia bacterium]
MNSPLGTQLATAFPQLKFMEEELLSGHTYSKIGGPAEVFVRLYERKDFEDLVVFCRKHSIELTMLGGGSNVLIADAGIRGLVIKNLTKHYEVKVGENSGTIEVDSGLPTNVIVRASVDAGLEGLEKFLGLPGSVGGAVYNNSHFSGKDLIGNVVKTVHLIDATGEKVMRTRDEMEYAYDYSILQKTHEVIIWVEFELPKGDKVQLEKTMLEVTRHRATTQPLGIPSSGCMFKNALMPDGTKQSAGFLIDKAGLKGMKVGDAMVSPVHANFIVNTGHATQEQVEKLAQKVEAVIKEKFGVELHREVFRLGNTVN